MDEASHVLLCVLLVRKYFIYHQGPDDNVIRQATFHTPRFSTACEFDFSQ